VPGDGKHLKELCGRVAKEQDPVKLRELIAELSRLLQVEEENQKSKSPVAGSTGEGNQRNPTQNPPR
jgi:hypothetical protein